MLMLSLPAYRGINFFINYLPLNNSNVKNQPFQQAIVQNTIQIYISVFKNVIEKIFQNN